MLRAWLHGSQTQQIVTERQQVLLMSVKRPTHNRADQKTQFPLSHVLPLPYGTGVLPPNN